MPTLNINLGERIMTKKKTKQVAKRNEAPVAATASDLNEWGDNEMSSQDLVIPKILAMQGLSNFVTEGRATFGEFRSSVDCELMGDLKNPIEFVPVYMEKIWVVSKKVGDQFKFVRVDKVTPENERLPWSEVVNGVDIKRDFVRNFYVLLEGHAIPFIISFKGMSARSGKVLATQMYTLNSAANLPPCAIKMQLSGVKDSNDKGTYVVLQAEPCGNASQEECKSALKWYKTIVSGNTKADNSDLHTDDSAGEFDTNSNQF